MALGGLILSFINLECFKIPRSRRCIFMICSATHKNYATLVLCSKLTTPAQDTGMAATREEPNRWPSSHLGNTCSWHTRMGVQRLVTTKQLAWRASALRVYISRSALLINCYIMIKAIRLHSCNIIYMY